MLHTATTAMEITQKHSSTCDLNKYIEMHGGIGSLQIEDVRSLERADQAVFPEMIPVAITTKDTYTAEVLTVSTVHTDLQPFTDNLHIPTSKSISPLSVVTNPIIIMSAVTLAMSADNAPNYRPLPMVTTLGTSSAESTVPLSMTTVPLHLVTTSTTDSNIRLISASTSSARSVG